MARFYAESGYPLDAALATDALERLLRDRKIGRPWAIRLDDEDAPLHRRDLWLESETCR